MHGTSLAEVVVSDALTTFSTRSTFHLVEYPKEWNNYGFKTVDDSMFTVIEKCKAAKGFCQWMSAMFTSFENFDEDAKHGAKKIHMHSI